MSKNYHNGIQYDKQILAVQLITKLLNFLIWLVTHKISRLIAVTSYNPTICRPQVNNVFTMRVDFA